MKRFGSILTLLLVFIASTVPSFAQSARGPFVPGRAYTAFDFRGSYFELPYVYQPSDTLAPAGLFVGWNDGNIYPNGSGPVAVGGGSVAVTLSKATCTYPAFSACNIIYANSSGTVAATLDIATARQAGNTILAYVQTSGSAVTSVQYPYQFSAGALPAKVYDTAPAAGVADITATTIATPAADGNFRISLYARQTVVGSSCAGNTTYAVQLVYQDPAAAAGQTVTVGTYTVTTNGTVGTIPLSSGAQSFVFRAKAATAIQYAADITVGGSCSPSPTIQLIPILEAL